VQTTEVIILFDEFGTPSFKDTTSSGLFMGASALYLANDEKKIFKSLDKSMGLSKTQPVKNNKISKNRAKIIARETSSKKLHIAARYLDLNNKQLELVTNDYLRLSNLGRQIWREVKGRKDVHLLHSQILLHCIFDNILEFLGCYQGGNIQFNIFIDSFSYPKTDLHIVHEYCSNNLLKHVQKYIDNDMNKQVNVSFDPIKFFAKHNTSRERLIDCLNSIIGRSLLDVRSDKYDLEPRDLIQKGLGNKFSFGDITDETITFLHTSMYDDIQNTKIQDKPLIIL